MSDLAIHAMLLDRIERLELYFIVVNLIWALWTMAHMKTSHRKKEEI